MKEQDYETGSRRRRKKGGGGRRGCKGKGVGNKIFHNYNFIMIFPTGKKKKKKAKRGGHDSVFI